MSTNTLVPNGKAHNRLSWKLERCLVVVKAPHVPHTDPIPACLSQPYLMEQGVREKAVSDGTQARSCMQWRRGEKRRREENSNTGAWQLYSCGTGVPVE